MDFKRRSLAIEIDGNKFVLQEPLHFDIINAQRLSREVNGNGQASINELLFRTLLALRMIQSWTAADESVVKSEDYQKTMEQLPARLTEKLLMACDKVFEETETDKAFLTKLKQAESS